MKIKNIPIIVAGLTVLSLTACSGDGSEAVNVGEKPVSALGQEILFSAEADGRASTRTAVGTIDQTRLQSDGFGVFACHSKYSYISSSITANLMWNQQVGYDGTKWTYEPVKSWPEDEYVHFFAYAPYSAADGLDDASSCIVDFSNVNAKGDPWLVYQLGGTADDWQNHQVDLLYAFIKDCVRPEHIGDCIKFSFRHALAGAGDKVTVVCTDELRNRLSQFAANRGETVTLTLDRVALDYTLTRKGRLILNNAIEPNWQIIASEDPMVHRNLELSVAQVLATATSSSCTAVSYETTDLGVFYIPLSPDGQSQQVEVTVYYSLSTGYAGSVSAVIPLHAEVASQNQNFELKLSKELPLN